MAHTSSSVSEREDEDYLSLDLGETMSDIHLTPNELNEAKERILAFLTEKSAQ